MRRILYSTNESVKVQDQCNRLKGGELLGKVNTIYSTKIRYIPQDRQNFFWKSKEGGRCKTEKLKKKGRYEHDKVVSPNFRRVICSAYREMYATLLGFASQSKYSCLSFHLWCRHPMNGRKRIGASMTSCLLCDKILYNILWKSLKEEVIQILVCHVAWSLYLA